MKPSEAIEDASSARKFLKYRGQKLMNFYLKLVILPFS